MWFKIQNQQVLLNILAKPNARKTALLKVTDDKIQIALHAKPHHGEANKELITYLSKLFQLPKSAITIEKGESSRHKKISIPLTKTTQRFLDDPTESFNSVKASKR